MFIIMQKIGRYPGKEFELHMGAQTGFDIERFRETYAVK